MSTEHILIVTGLFEDGVDERKFEIRHSGPVVDCILWVDCPDNSCACHSTRPRFAEANNKTIGDLDHVWDGEGQCWLVRSDPPECFFASGFASDRLPDLAVDLIWGQVPLSAGRYLITPHYEGDGEYDIEIDRPIVPYWNTDAQAVW